MRVLHISTRDIVGGAARAAYRLHAGLQSIGVESRMLVAAKSSEDPTVDQHKLSRALPARAHRALRRRRITTLERNVASALAPGKELFSLTQSVYVDGLTVAIEQADVVNLHWTAGFLDVDTFFAAFPRGKPLVWTLHDVNPFTAGCHYFGDCGRFTTQCGPCPQLTSAATDAIAGRAFDAKQAAYSKLQQDGVVIVGPSKWVAREAQRSALMGRFRVEHVPCGLDLEAYHPRDHEGARRALGLGTAERLILFVSDHLQNPRKGLDLVAAAIEQMDDKNGVTLGLIGSGRKPELSGVRVLHFGRIESELLLSLIYSSADVLVVASREESFGQIASEAAACGCPVVAFAVGGLTDIVEDGRTGFLVPPFDVRELADALTKVIRHRAPEAMRRESRRAAAERYPIELQAVRYANLYREMLGIAAPKPRSAAHRSLAAPVA